MDQALHTLATSNPNKSPEWYTPRCYADMAREVFLGEIDLDPASSLEANEFIGAKSIYTREDNGLLHAWGGNVWLNAPSAEKGVHKGQATWQHALIKDYDAKRVTQAVMLVYRVAPDTQWFQDLFRFPICFVRGRIKFEAPAGTYAKAGSQPLHASAFIYMGPLSGQFYQVFSRIGHVTMPNCWE